MINSSASRHFPWTRLPEYIQQRILSYALLPDGRDTPLIIGKPDHSTHLREFAVPVLLALGSWSAYFNGVSVLYHAVHMDLCAHRRSSMNFLTTRRALRPRSMVVNLRITIDIKKSLPLFDTGYTIRQSKGKLIKMNVPTALRCMKVHERLMRVEFLIQSFAATDDVEQVPEDYLPMAEIELVSRSSLSLLDDQTAHSSPRTRPDIKQAVTVIAPAFLACRAWQSGFLPLFEDDTFQRGASLGLLLKRRRADQRRTEGKVSGETIFRVDGASLMRYWLGGTIVELLDETVQPSSWIDPFTLSAQRADNIDDIASSMASHQIEHLPGSNAVVDSIEGEHDMAAPHAKTDGSFESEWKSGGTEYEGPYGVVNVQRRLDDARLGYSAINDVPGWSKGYNTPSDDDSLSDEGEMRTLHQRFGVGSRMCESMSSISPSSPGTRARSVLIGGTASPSSNSELEPRWTISRRSVSLAEDKHGDSSAACLTEDSSGSDQSRENTQAAPMLDIRTLHKNSEPVEHDA